MMTMSWRPGVASWSFVFFVVLFALWPELDLVVSSWFYNASLNSFPANDNAVVQFIYWLFKEMPKVILPLLLVMSLLPLFRFAPAWSKRQQRKWVFLLVFLLLGPGIIVHTVFKDNWDRARPRDVVELGGEKQFTPAWVISDQCDKNCSFVSGHAAMGYAFFALGWVFASRRWFFLGVGTGVAMGLIRVMQGGHFLSDIIFAGYICFFVAYWVARWILGRSSITQSD
ncbi:phosphatase PAP2 family protein [Maribrevibacterium harenarium]|uniref:Phosphatase PAP2 family protein n=1 Tax=Maribrevibacterium harenarium TaxID=2589817 RepID=A0A501X228_9GAMM|nr:phosphatase PAP2 family protein [Maribrevibacterium harenarium]TPE54513.1 phosphatase PAP2 family protein [Maribrevibacterium harenarium]